VVADVPKCKSNFSRWIREEHLSTGFTQVMKKRKEKEINPEF
jgi:hypothetical protein